MGYTAAPLEKLIEEFSKFPGIGRKGATRMAYQVLSMSDEDAAALAGAIQGAHTKLHRCRICQNYTEAELCPICASTKRDPSVICVVETPRDVQAFERTREYHGLYHVLHGLLSPMDGITATLPPAFTGRVPLSLRAAFFAPAFAAAFCAAWAALVCFAAHSAFARSSFWLVTSFSNACCRSAS